MRESKSLNPQTLQSLCSPGRRLRQPFSKPSVGAPWPASAMERQWPLGSQKGPTSRSYVPTDLRVPSRFEHVKETMLVSCYHEDSHALLPVILGVVDDACSGCRFLAPANGGWKWAKLVGSLGLVLQHHCSSVDSKNNHTPPALTLVEATVRLTRPSSGCVVLGLGVQRVGGWIRTSVERREFYIRLFGNYNDETPVMVVGFRV